MNTTNITRRICPTAAPRLLLLALPFLAASVASASDTILPDGRSAAVSLRDVDLSKPEGRAIARERIGGMARILCARIGESTDLDPAARYQDCVAKATDQAMQQVFNPSLVGATKAPPTVAATKAALSGSEPGHQAHVSVADLDLSTSEGVNAAHERVHQAARQLCMRVVDELDLSRDANFIKCIDESMALAELNIQELAARQIANPTLLGKNR